MSDSPFADLRGLPYYDEPSLHMNLVGQLWAWEFEGWKPESMSWKTGCYIHGGLSRQQTVFRGPDVKEFFSSILVNSLENFPVGSMKHGIYCNEDGLLTAHAILQRNDEHEYRYYAGHPWPHYKLMSSAGRYDVEMEPTPWYLFQIAGPTSLETLERATGESLRDIAFLRFRDAKINGTTVEVGRIGMSGNLAYELRGPIEDGPAIYDAVFKAGKDLGIQRLGWRTYLVNHVEGGFPQMTWQFQRGRPRSGLHGDGGGERLQPAAQRLRQRRPRRHARTPAHARGGRMAARDQVRPRLHRARRARGGGRRPEAHRRDPALEPRRRRRHLRLPPAARRGVQDDRPADLTTVDAGHERHADHLLKDGRPIGWSSGTIYSYWFREVLSHACLDVDQNEIGNEVTVQWGDHGGRIKDVRATVERFPYLTDPRNSDVDTATLS